MKIDFSKISEAAPVPEEVFEGSQAYVAGLPQSANPYPKGSKECEDWHWGWVEGENYEQYLNSD